ncbi:TPA: hypothetical protein DCY83_03020 [Candidatus Wolfebacteria bacterium]|nr:hypothetical protein [Candidatus Wolfebacteria bacterium]
MVSLAFASAAWASVATDQRSKKEIAYKQADQRESGPAMASAQLNHTEASTLKVGVVILANFKSEGTAIIAIGGRGEATVNVPAITAVAAASAGSSIEKRFSGATGTMIRAIGTINSAGRESPGCDIVASFDQGALFAGTTAFA